MLRIEATEGCECRAFSSGWRILGAGMDGEALGEGRFGNLADELSYL